MTDGTVLTLAGSIITALATAIVALWRMQTKRADECERKHESAQKDIITLTGDVGELKGRVAMSEEISPKIDKITEEVVEVLNTHLDELKEKVDKLNDEL